MAEEVVRSMPHSVEAEQIILGSIIFDNECMPDIMRGSIGKRMDPDLPSLRIVFNLVQQSRNILVIP